MADVSDAADSQETPNQRQARLRREKRQKKMADEGEDRLARIKALNGGVAPPEEILGGPTSETTTTAAAQGPKAAYVEDPDEVDISEASTPSRPNVNAKDDPLRAAMLQMQQEEARNQRQKGAQGSEEDDPMVRMMEQMMSFMGGSAGGASNPQDPNAKPPDIPPALKALLGAGVATGNNNEDLVPAPTSSEYLWRIAHTIFAFMLAGYIALTSTFNGSKLARSQSFYVQETVGYSLERRLFLIFCTAELILQSSRYFAEGGQLRGPGMIAKVANSGFVPEPWAGYIRIAGRYIGIAQTIFTDAMVVIFVFGALAWWNGMAATA